MFFGFASLQPGFKKNGGGGGGGVGKDEQNGLFKFNHFLLLLNIKYHM